MERAGVGVGGGFPFRKKSMAEKSYPLTHEYSAESRKGFFGVAWCVIKRRKKARAVWCSDGVNDSKLRFVFSFSLRSALFLSASSSSPSMPRPTSIMSYYARCIRISCSFVDLIELDTWVWSRFLTLHSVTWCTPHFSLAFPLSAVVPFMTSAVMFLLIDIHSSYTCFPFAW